MKVCWPHKCKVWQDSFRHGVIMETSFYSLEKRSYTCSSLVHSSCSCFTLSPTHEDGVALVLKLYGFESKNVLNSPNYKILRDSQQKQSTATYNCEICDVAGGMIACMDFVMSQQIYFQSKVRTSFVKIVRNNPAFP